MRVSIILSTILILISGAAGSNSEWPVRVLITNDDGIDDPALIELAVAFSEISETVVVAPKDNRSSSTDYISVLRSYTLDVEQLLLAEDIRGYSVNGYPGDCVFLALRGIMLNNPPDLVLSGINSGPNLWFDWIASGTIGAARIAAYWGVPAIAVSGYDESIPGSLEAITDWVLRLSQTDAVRQLKRGQYLTVSFPRIPPEEIRGVRVAERAGILLDFTFSTEDTAFNDGVSEVWWMEQPQLLEPSSSSSDAALYDSCFIVVVPMSVNEIDYELLEYFHNEPGSLPYWGNDH